jgi:flagellar biosynthesis regulator FlaF
MDKKILHKQETLAQGKDFNRWRLWRCIEGSDNERHTEAKEEIYRLNSMGFEAKVWSPLIQHLTSGHTHIVVLATFNEFCRLAGIDAGGVR